MTTQDTLQIRWLIRRDMPQVLSIENAGFQFPWTEEDFLICLKQRNVIGAVAEDEWRVKGFMVYELHKEKFRLLNLAVAPFERRTGVGKQLILRLVDKLSQQRRTTIETGVRESNLSGQMFLQSCGFRAIRVLRNSYDETNEDGYLFRYKLKGTT